jgi:hypothetical protein
MMSIVITCLDGIVTHRMDVVIPVVLHAAVMHGQDLNHLRKLRLHQTALRAQPTPLTALLQHVGDGPCPLDFSCS